MRCSLNGLPLGKEVKWLRSSSQVIPLSRSQSNLILNGLEFILDRRSVRHSHNSASFGNPLRTRFWRRLAHCLLRIRNISYIVVVGQQTGVVWFAIKMPLTADSPSRHRKISKVEKDYICSSLKDSIKRVIYPQHPFQQLANFSLFYRKLHQCRGVVCLDQKHVGLSGQLMLAMPGDFTHYLLNCQVIWITYFISIWNRCLKVVSFPTRLCVDIYIFDDAEFVRVCSSVPRNVALLSSVQYYCWPPHCQSNF